jgi:hypothetical protein
MQRGQASIEYVVVVALVAVVSVVAGATVAAPGIANDVGRGFRRALCVVGGGDCLATERRPCITATDERDQTVTVHAAFIRVGRHAGILRQDLSDGTVLVTEIEDVSGGGQVGLGLRGRLQLAGVDLAGGGELHAAALARLGHSRTFHVRDARAAIRLVERLVVGSPQTMLLDLPVRLVKRALGGGDGLPRADRVTFTAGADTDASAELGKIADRAEIDAALRASLGGRLDRRTGRRTLFFDVAGEAAGSLRAAVAQGRLAGGGRVVLGVTYDRDGRPLLLTASVAGDAHARAGALPGLAPRGKAGASPGAPAHGRLTAGAAGRLELDARLDLTVGANALAVRRLVGALGPLHPRPAAAASAARELAARMAHDSDLDVRAYTTQSSMQGIGADAALGARIGADVELVHASSRLLAAWNRPTGGVWERRIDCVRR